MAVPADGAGGDEPNLEGAVVAGSGDLGVIGAGGEGYDRRRLPLDGAAPVDLHHFCGSIGGLRSEKSKGAFASNVSKIEKTDEELET